MRKVVLPRLFYYLLGNFSLGLGTALFAHAYQGVGVNVAFPYALYNLFGGMSYGHWEFFAMIPFWLAALFVNKGVKVSGLFSFAGAFVLAEFIDLGMFLFAGVSITSIWGVSIAILGALLINGFAVGCIGVSHIPINPVIFLELELARKTESKTKPISFSRWVLYGNLFLMGVAVLVGFIGFASGGYGGAVGFSASMRLFTAKSGVGIGTLATAFFQAAVIKGTLVVWKKIAVVFDDLGALGVNMDLDLLAPLHCARKESQVKKGQGVTRLR